MSAEAVELPQPHRVEERTIDTGRIRLSIRERPGAEPALVCLHGLASNARWWDPVGARLAGRHRVIAVDQRGHGHSDKPDHGYGFDDIVADDRALLRALGIARAVVVGHSWGASVALRYAVTVPDEVLGTVCVDGGAADLRSIFGDSWAVAEVAMRPPDLDGVAREVMVEMARSGPLAERLPPDEVVEILLGNFEEVGPGRLRPRLRLGNHMQIARALYELDSAALIRAQPHPVLFVLAAQSARGGAERQARLEATVAAAGERAALRWIDGGHDLPVQRPDEVAEAIAEFAAGLGG